MKHKQCSFVVCAALLMVFGLPALAQPRPPQLDRSVQFRFGGFFLAGDGDFWADNESVFTIEASDFDGLLFGATYSHGFNRYLELDLNADYTGGSTVSEYRNFVSGSGFPILHESRLQMWPLTAGVRLVPFGRAKPGARKPVLFVGAGAGVNFWSYEEFGDFIDFSDPTNPIILGDFREDGEAFVAYGLFGIEFPLAPAFNVGIEARYFSSDDKLSGDFAGLGTLDMSGWSASVSGNWRF
jgi:hypothetical protein